MKDQTVTAELLHQATRNTGYLNGRQLAILGVNFSVTTEKGWKKRLIGIRISEEQARDFVAAQKPQKLPVVERKAAVEATPLFPGFVP